MKRIVVVAFAVVALASLCANAQQATTATTSPAVAQAVRGVDRLRHTMRDPDSFQVEKVFTLTDKKGDEVTCIEYRAKNGYGGMNRNAAHYTEHGGKPHLDMNGDTGYGYCAVTKYKPFVEITSDLKKAVE